MTTETTGSRRKSGVGRGPGVSPTSGMWSTEFEGKVSEVPGIDVLNDNRKEVQGWS